VQKLRKFPELGGVIEDIGLPYRELIYENFRIIYRFDGHFVRILTVMRGARLLDPKGIPEE